MSESSNSTSTFDTRPWYAIRTFNCQEQKVSRYLQEQEWVHFIPMTYVQDLRHRSDHAVSGQSEEEAEKPKMIQVPAVHNLLFVQKRDNQQEFLKVLSECPIPVSIFRHPGDRRLCEISSREMIELRMLCDPEYKTSVFMTQGEAEAMVGKDVRVINGPLKGTVGRLVRKQKQYYFLKAFIGLGVMVRISRWYCEPI